MRLERVHYAGVLRGRVWRSCESQGEGGNLLTDLALTGTHMGPKASGRLDYRGGVGRLGQW